MDHQSIMQQIADDQVLRGKLKSLAYAKFSYLFAAYELEDLLQEAMLKAFEQLDRYNPQRGNLHQFVLKLAKNRWIDLGRSADGQWFGYRITGELPNEHQ